MYLQGKSHGNVFQYIWKVVKIFRLTLIVNYSFYSLITRIYRNGVRTISSRYLKPAFFLCPISVSKNRYLILTVLMNIQPPPQAPLPSLQRRGPWLLYVYIYTL